MSFTNDLANMTQENYYGMFSDFGNDAVHSIVRRAQMLNMSWSKVREELESLSEQPDFAEDTDTAVLEYVYSALN